METPDQAVRRLIARYRLARGMNQTDLAREVTKLGASMRQTTVSKIEDGTRKVGVDELLAIAAALDVSPIMLMIPVDQEDDYEVAAGHLHYPWFVYEWFVGTHGLTREPGVATALDYYAPVRSAQVRCSQLELQGRQDSPEYRTATQELVDAAGDMNRAGWPSRRLIGERGRGRRARTPRRRIEETLGRSIDDDPPRED